MHFLDRHGATLAAVVGGFAAVFSVLRSLGPDSFYAETSGAWYGQFVSAQWAGTVTLVSAVLTLVGLQAGQTSKLVAAAALLGIVIIGLPEILDIAANQAVTTNALGAGLVLGSVASTTAARKASQFGLAVGLLAATLYFQAIYAHLPIDEYRWMVSLGPSYVGSTVPIYLLVPLALLLVTVAIRTAPSTDRLDAQSAIVLLALPFGFLVAYAYLGSETSSTPTWILAAFVSAVFVLCASRLLEGNDGNVLLVGFAVAAASVSGIGYGPTGWWVALIGVGALIVGAYLGLRRPAVRLWIGVLAGVTATGLLAGTDLLDAVPTAAYLLVFPFAVGAAVASCIPVSVAASVVGPALPLAMTLFSATAPAPAPVFGWATDADDYVTPMLAVHSPSIIGVVIAAVAIVAMGAARHPA